MKTKIKKLAFGLALALGAGVLSAAETVKVGVLHSLSGTMAISETSLKDVALMTIDDINAKGGISGRKIEAMSNDYAYKVPAAEELYKKYVNEGAVAIQGWGTGDTEAMRSKISADELPFMSASSTAAQPRAVSRAGRPERELGAFTLAPS